MGLEQDIKQPKFRNESQKVLLNILYTNNYLLEEMGKGFKEYKVTRQQYNVLRILNGQYPKPATVNLIKERMLDKMSDASRIVDRLHKKKLILKEACSQDRRATDILISKDGLKLLERMEPYIKKFDKLVSRLTQKEASTLNNLLDKLRV